MMTEKEEETEYGTDIYEKLKELRKSVNECGADATYLVNHLNHFLEEYDVSKELNDEIESLANQFKNGCKCLQKNKL